MHTLRVAGQMMAGSQDIAQRAGFSQPLPRSTHVIQVAPNHTVIARNWNPGDVARCRLCPAGRCVAMEDLCQFKVPEAVDKYRARTYSTHHLGWPDAAGAAPEGLG